MHSSGGCMAGPGHGPFFDDSSFPDNSTKLDFESRLRILLENRDNRAFFSPCEQDSNTSDTPDNSLVVLWEFAQWAYVAQEEWKNLPPELLAMPVNARKHHGQNINPSDNRVDCATFELLSNGKEIDWDFWNKVAKIRPHQAAKLKHCIDPIKWEHDAYAGGKIPKKMIEDIKRVTQLLEGRADFLTLAGLVEFLGEEAPFNMKAAVSRATEEHHGAPAESKAQSEADENTDGLKKREKQIRAIEVEIAALNYSPLKIPDGGKPKIQAACKKNHVALFGAGDDPFKDAWKVGVSQERFRMTNHQRYAKK